MTYVFLELQRKREGKDQESIQSSTTPDPNIIRESDTSTRKYHIREIQEANPYPTDDHKATINRYHRKQNQTQKRSTKEAPSLNDRNKINWRA